MPLCGSICQDRTCKIFSLQDRAECGNDLIMPFIPNGSHAFDNKTRDRVFGNIYNPTL